MIAKHGNADCIFTWIGYYVASVAIGMGLPALILWLVCAPSSPFAFAKPQQPTISKGEHGMIYKVWLSVERCDEENDSYVTLGMPDELGVFAQPGHADLFAQSIVAAVDGLRAAIATEQKATEKESLLTAVTLLATSDFIPRRVANELQAAINQAEF